MQTRHVRLLLVAGAMLAMPAGASADFMHIVMPGETLSSVAAQDGLTVAQLAAADGISPYTQLITGQALAIPPQSYDAGAGATTSATDESESTSAEGATGTTSATGTTGTTTATSAASGSGGSYVVQPGDTLSAIAARAGTTASQLAALNGLSEDGVLLSGTALVLPGASSTATYVSASGTSTSSSSATAAGQPVGASAVGDASAGPYPTDQTVSGSQIAGIASSGDVAPALAQAIGWQESGEQRRGLERRRCRRHADHARNLEWIQNSLNVGAPLSPASATDNVRGGVLMLRSLLNSTGGDAALAAAGYYQGLSSVQQYGMYSDTQQYVNDVMSLMHQFGG